MKNVQFVNLTPHDVVIYRDGVPVCRFPASGAVARAAVSERHVDTIDGIDIVRMDYGVTTGLPSPQDGVMYIVSLIAAHGAPGRQDLVIPSDVVRDGAGNIVGCKKLSVL